MSDLRETIREILAEELSRLERGSGRSVSEEAVRMESDADLAAFTRKLLRMARDPVMVERLERGSHVFRLQPATDRVPGSPAMNGSRGGVATSRGEIAEIAKRLITERDVSRLASAVTTLSIPRGARLTPLAVDELRRRGVEILRKPR